MKYSIGDWVKVRVNQAESLVFEVDFYHTRYTHFPVREYLVLGFTTMKYILQVPENISEDILILEAADLKLWKLKSRDLGARVIFVPEFAVGGRRPYDPYRQALTCQICQESYPWAEPNQPNNTLICWSCRQSRSYLF